MNQDPDRSEKRPANSAGETDAAIDWVPEPAPAVRLMGAYTGRLKAAKVPPSSEEAFWRKRAKRRPSLKNLVLEEIPEATEYSDDEALMDPVEIVRLVKAFPELDALLQEALSPYQDEIAPEPRRHRPRIEGRFDLLYVAWICSKDPAMQSFWHTWRSSQVWEECGFEERPDYQVMRLRFIEFEELERRGFRETAHKLIRNAREHDPLIGMVLMIDETRFDSVARFEHCCPDRNACRKLWREQKKELGAAANRLRGPAKYLLRATDETFNAAKADEVEAPEPVAGEVPANVALLVGIEGRYIYREVDGHLYRAIDKTAGCRSTPPRRIRRGTAA